jgi:hypothetical protein
MNDVKDLLVRALDDTPEPVVNPATDVARGRTRLRRRRGAILGGAAATVLVLGAVPLALGPGAGSSAPTVASSSTGKTLTSIGLVSYTGKQPRGYTVAWVPDGWVIQGGDLSALTIAPKGGVPADPGAQDREVAKAKDKAKARAQIKQGATSQPDDYTWFEGKLAVMSASENEQHDLGTAIKVDGRPGYLRSTEGIQILSYTSATGRWVDIQVPSALGWKQAEIVKFAGGITVSKKAENTFG